MREKNDNLIARNLVITKKHDELISSISKKLGIRKSELIRMILNEYFDLYSKHLPKPKN